MPRADAYLRKARTDTTVAWHGLVASRAKQSAATQSLKAGAIGVTAAETATQKGLQTMLEVLKARMQRDAAWRDLQKAQYEMIVNALKLRATSGLLTDTDLIGIDSWLMPR